YYAHNASYPNLRVPLEPLGEGQPRILSWELKEAPYRGIGVLTFHGGILNGPKGPEEVELAAVLDLRTSKIVAIEPHRQGEEVSAWTWADNGRLTVASIDGVTDEFGLREVRQTPVASRPRQRPREEDGSGPDWAPW